MLISEIRNVLWNVFVKEHGDHVEIEFETGEETEIVTEVLAKNYPTRIEQKMELSYVPEGCIKGDEILTLSQYQIIRSLLSDSNCSFVYNSLCS